jgi:hypothetical protein
MLRRIFRLRSEEGPGGWRRLHNGEIHNLHASPTIIRVIKSRKMKWTGYVARMWEMRNVYKMWVGKPEGKKSLGRHRCRW